MFAVQGKQGPILNREKKKKKDRHYNQTCRGYRPSYNLLGRLGSSMLQDHTHNNKESKLRH